MNDAPRLLAIDTATERMSVAVCEGDRIWGAEEEGGARASQRLLPLVFELLGRSAVELRSVDAVGFGRGPGAFTGLRTACSVAQGLAFGIGAAVLPLDSLLIAAEDAREHEGIDELWVAMDARMDEAYAAHYRCTQGRWQALREPALWTLPALARAWRDAPPRCVAGNAAAAFGDRLPLGAAQRIDAPRDRASALARLARWAWTEGAAIDAALALPLYLRDKVALTTAERAAAKVPA